MYWAIQAGGWDNASEINRNKKKSRQNGAGCLTDEGSTCSYLEKQYGPSPSGRFSLVIVFQKPLLPELHTAPIWDNKLPTHSPSTSLNILSRLTTRFVRSDNRSIKTECTTFLHGVECMTRTYLLINTIWLIELKTRTGWPNLTSHAFSLHRFLIYSAFPGVDLCLTWFQAPQSQCNTCYPLSDPYRLSYKKSTGVKLCRVHFISRTNQSSELLKNYKQVCWRSFELWLERKVAHGTAVWNPRFKGF